MGSLQFLPLKPSRPSRLLSPPEGDAARPCLNRGQGLPVVPLSRGAPPHGPVALVAGSAGAWAPGLHGGLVHREQQDGGSHSDAWGESRTPRWKSPRPPARASVLGEGRQDLCGGPGPAACDSPGHGPDRSPSSCASLQVQYCCDFQKWDIEAQSRPGRKAGQDVHPACGSCHARQQNETARSSRSTC